MPFEMPWRDSRSAVSFLVMAASTTDLAPTTPTPRLSSTSSSILPESSSSRTSTSPASLPKTHVGAFDLPGDPSLLAEGWLSGRERRACSSFSCSGAVGSRYRARWYDPEIGRFMSRDPLNSLSAQLGMKTTPATRLSSNDYQYANADPVGNNDPSGLETRITGDFAYRVSTFSALAEFTLECNKDEFLVRPRVLPGQGSLTIKSSMFRGGNVVTGFVTRGYRRVPKKVWIPGIPFKMPTPPVKLPMPPEGIVIADCYKPDCRD